MSDEIKTNQVPLREGAPIPKMQQMQDDGNKRLGVPIPDIEPVPDNDPEPNGDNQGGNGDQGSDGGGNSERNTD